MGRGFDGACQPPLTATDPLREGGPSSGRSVGRSISDGSGLEGAGVPLTGMVVGIGKMKNFRVSEREQRNRDT